jgi:hypothetical protein
MMIVHVGSVLTSTMYVHIPFDRIDFRLHGGCGASGGGACSVTVTGLHTSCIPNSIPHALANTCSTRIRDIHSGSSDSEEEEDGGSGHGSEWRAAPAYALLCAMLHVLARRPLMHIMIDHCKPRLFLSACRSIARAMATAAASAAAAILPEDPEALAVRIPPTYVLRCRHVEDALKGVPDDAHDVTVWIHSSTQKIEYQCFA